MLEVPPTNITRGYALSGDPEAWAEAQCQRVTASELENDESLLLTNVREPSQKHFWRPSRCLLQKSLGKKLFVVILRRGPKLSARE